MRCNRRQLLYGLAGMGVGDNAAATLVNVAGSRYFASGDGSITINGSGFGAKTTPAPQLFDDFEGYSNGQSGDTLGPYDIYNAEALPTVSTARYYGGTRAIKFDIPAITTQPAGGTVFETFPQFGFVTSGTVRKFYFSFWQYVEQTRVATQNNYGNPFSEIHQEIRVFKQFRVGSSTQYSGHPQFANTEGPVPPATSSHDVGAISESGVNYGSQPNTGGIVAGQWNRCEYFGDYGTAGNADGSFRIRINGVDVFSISSVEILDAAGTAKLDWAFLFNGYDYYWDTAYTLTIDEVYFDSTWQHAVLTDNATYGSSTKWAEQVCTAWSDTEVVIASPNYAGFSSGATAYLHIFNSSGVGVAYQSVEVP